MRSFGKIATESIAQVLLRDRAVFLDDLKRMSGERRVFGTRAALRHLARIAIANQAVEERVHGSGDEEWSFAEDIRLECTT